MAQLFVHSLAGGSQSLVNLPDSIFCQLSFVFLLEEFENKTRDYAAHGVAIGTRLGCEGLLGSTPSWLECSVISLVKRGLHVLCTLEGFCKDSVNGLSECAWPKRSAPKQCGDLPASNGSQQSSHRVHWDVPRVEHAEERHVRDDFYSYLNFCINILKMKTESLVQILTL